MSLSINCSIRIRTVAMIEGISLACMQLIAYLLPQFEEAVALGQALLQFGVNRWWWASTDSGAAGRPIVPAFGHQ